jgi:phosphomannomutase
MSLASRPKVILLFDVDGTLTKPRLQADTWMLDFLSEARSQVYLGYVGGSDLHKIKEQLGQQCPAQFDYGFSQNGLHATKGGELLAENVS